MKKILIYIALVIMPVIACSQSLSVDEIKYKDTATLEWNAVETDGDGIPLSPTDTLTYEVFMYDSTLQDSEEFDDQDVTRIVLIKEVSNPECELVFTDLPRTLYFVGVRSKVITEDLTVILSDIAWSYNPEVTDNSPFGYVRQTGIFSLPLLSGLRDSGI